MDEVDAIGDVEREFGVQLDYSKSREWTTVGDVFEALQQRLPSDQADKGNVWARFSKAISAETGVDPSKVTPTTLLLGKAIFDWRLALIVGCGIGIVMAVARFW